MTAAVSPFCQAHSITGPSRNLGIARGAACEAGGKGEVDGLMNQGDKASKHKVASLEAPSQDYDLPMSGPERFYYDRSTYTGIHGGFHLTGHCG